MMLMWKTEEHAALYLNFSQIHRESTVAKLVERETGTR